MEIRIKRAYDLPARGDGKRILVDRLWPLGMTKEKLQLDERLKDAAPSDALRNWFGHDPAKWDKFKQRYFVELDKHSAAWHAIWRAARRGTETLVYGAQDMEHNNAGALKAYLETRG